MSSFKEFRSTHWAGEPLKFNTIPERARNIQGMTAGFTSRFISVLIDIAVIAVFVLCSYGLWIFMRYVLSVFYDLPQLSGVPFLIIGYALMWFYWTWSWATGGKTLGNLLMGLRVQMISGGSLSLGPSALRALFSVAFPVGLAWAIINRNNRSVQDIVLRTQVVYDWTPLASKLQ